MGCLHVVIVGLQTLAGLGLSTAGHPLLWFCGQLMLGFALLQWFIVLHEAGHMSLFRTRILNVAAGHLASVFAVIPFASWRRVHGLHHLWTGWQDKDPTTAALTPRPRSALQRTAVDVAWRCWLPLFSVVYRLGNYWHLPRLLGAFRAPSQRFAIVVNAVLLLGFYAGGNAAFGWEACFGSFALALVIGLALQDPLILSQHTHIPQPVSGGRIVQPLPPRAQLAFTRSLRFPDWFAQWLLINFNAHELHHLHASVPGYRLPSL
jgi:acyl-lipid omega-6 desaturase (Delta-12 desaturase)